MQYATANSSDRPTITGAILQALVSDNEFFDAYANDAAKRWLLTAQRMVSDGQGEELLPLDASKAVSSGSGNGDDHDDLPEQYTPFTAYRFASLHAAG